MYAPGVLEGLKLLTLPAVPGTGLPGLPTRWRHPECQQEGPRKAVWFKADRGDSVPVLLHVLRYLDRGWRVLYYLGRALGAHYVATLAVGAHVVS